MHKCWAREVSQLTFTGQKDRWKNVVFLLKIFQVFILKSLLSIKSKLLPLACNELYHLVSIYLPPLWTPLLQSQISFFYYSWFLESFAPGYGKARSFPSFRSHLNITTFQRLLSKWKYHHCQPHLHHCALNGSASFTSYHSCGLRIPTQTTAVACCLHKAIKDIITLMEL